MRFLFSILLVCFFSIFIGIFMFAFVFFLIGILSLISFYFILLEIYVRYNNFKIHRLSKSKKLGASCKEKCA
jgi:hypothetical protein